MLVEGIEKAVTSITELTLLVSLHSDSSSSVLKCSSAPPAPEVLSNTDPDSGWVLLKIPFSSPRFVIQPNDWVKCLLRLGHLSEECYHSDCVYCAVFFVATNIQTASTALLWYWKKNLQSRDNSVVQCSPLHWIKIYSVLLVCLDMMECHNANCRWSYNISSLQNIVLHPLLLSHAVCCPPFSFDWPSW